MPIYIISPVTLYNEDNEQFETKVGINTKYMPLQYSVWGESEATSRAKAELLVKALDAYHSSLNPTVHHNSLVN